MICGIASIKATFGVDLHTANLHWFEFCYMMASVGKDTSLSNAMEVRDYSTKDLKGAERAKVIKAKRALTPPVDLTEAEKRRDDNFKREMENLVKVRNNNG